MTLHLRKVVPRDEAFVAQMLAEAATWDRPAGEPLPPLAEVLDEPRVADYVEGWGRAGDDGMIAEQDEEPIGACWFRRFTAEHPGYGFLGDDAAGIGLAVRPGHRGRGIGTRLLSETIDLARRRGIPALGLSVAKANPARRLYLRAGFVEVGREGGSLTMRLDVRPG